VRDAVTAHLIWMIYHNDTTYNTFMRQKMRDVRDMRDVYGYMPPREWVAVHHMFSEEAKQAALSQYVARFSPSHLTPAAVPVSLRGQVAEKRREHAAAVAARPAARARDVAEPKAKRPPKEKKSKAKRKRRRKAGAMTATASVAAPATRLP
jgi:hypothetical protein